MSQWQGIVCAALVLVGCAESSTLVVQLRTEMRPGVEFDRVETVLYAGSGISALDLPQMVAPGVPVTEARDTYNGERVAELRDVAPGAYLVRVQLLDGQRVVGTGLTATLVDAASQIIDVYINRQCRGVECPGAAGRLNEIACLGGRCVDPSCPADPSACPPPECATDTECPGGEFGCVTGRCLAGVCVTVTEDARCSVGTCVLQSGCMEPELDAGPADAGALMDAGPDGGAVEAGVMDAGPPDTGPPDTGPPDTGPPDTGPPDTGPPDTGPPDTGPPEPPCIDVPRSSGNISFSPLFSSSGSPPEIWSAPDGLSCPSALGAATPYFRERRYCNRETAPYDFSFTIVDPIGDVIANPAIWGYLGTGVSDEANCVFITRGVGSETPQVLLSPGESFTMRVGSTTAGAEGFFRVDVNP